MLPRHSIVPALLAAALLAAPAAADVRRGVDAWSAGDYAAAVREWRGSAEAGDPDAQFNLAQAYRLGRGVGANLAEAERLYDAAARQGHVQAADNYGLLLFQSGRREQALPYVSAAAERGDPRAQYLLGIAHFNGDLVPRDWVRAYALLTLAQSAGLPQAASALQQMDTHIALEDRSRAQELSNQLRQQADARRASDLAAVDLALAGLDQPSVRTARAATAPVAAPRPVRAQPAPAQPARAPAPPATASGPWKLQLGAFAVRGNAEALWQRVAARPELAGKSRQFVAQGRVTRLLVAGFDGQQAAASACAGLRRSGHECLVTR